MLTPREAFRRDKAALDKLRETVGSSWFIKAIQAAQLGHSQRAKTVEEIGGVTEFVRELVRLTEDDPKRPRRLSSGITHRDDYGRSRNSPTTEDGSSGSPSQTAPGETSATGSPGVTGEG